MWKLIIPVVGIALAVAMPLTRHVQKVRAEHAAAAFLTELHAAQQLFRRANAAGGYASELASLTTSCPAGGPPAMTVSPDRLADAGYRVRLRAADGSRRLTADCHGRPTASDYYAAAEPMATETPAEQAFAVTSAGRIFVFFDRLAPLERDMSSGGLATAIDDLGAFTIP
jgi:type II secretory pathway pseudopilin PulG